MPETLRVKKLHFCLSWRCFLPDLKNLFSWENIATGCVIAGSAAVSLDSKALESGPHIEQDELIQPSQGLGINPQSAVEGSLQG